MTIIAPINGDDVDAQWAEDITDAVNTHETKLASGPLGFVARVERTSAVSTTTSEVVADQVSFTGAAARRYRITWVGSYESSAAGDLPTIRIRWQSGGTLTTGGTEIHVKTPGVDVANRNNPITLIQDVVPNIAGTISVGTTIVRGAGSGTVALSGASNNKILLLVEDIGV